LALCGDVTPSFERPVIDFLEAQEAVMSAALVGVMSFRQE
jgi:hypothetical protein